MFKEIINNKSFWKSVAGMGVAFVSIYLIVTILFFYGFNFSDFYDEKLADGQWVGFVIICFLSALVYGFIVSFGQFMSKMKKEQRDQ
ncbi:hypothetical protein L1I30_10055 [Gillisia sp. M10.2A]|uniref:Uncharacterized protein n=1 Tax=Gillisia lutea TaxID=2909668 RepID=A0ABS9EGL3_9FLAO|nr:hypothetical protein [Gillisia lutea]MCF4102010.1 hypothetical protein [Gillisia lutea]